MIENSDISSESIVGGREAWIHAYEQKVSSEYLRGAPQGCWEIDFHIHDQEIIVLTPDEQIKSKVGTLMLIPTENQPGK